MTDPAKRLIEAIDRKDTDGIRAAYAPGARLVTMTANTFGTTGDPDDIAAKLAEWFVAWGDEPGYSFLGSVREGDRVAVEFERVVTYEGAPWAVRQAHFMEVGPAGVVEHRIYCTGPRGGEAELAGAYATAAVR